MLYFVIALGGLTYPLWSKPRNIKVRYIYGKK